MTDDELLQKSTGVLIKTTLVDFPGLVSSSYFLKGCNLRCPYCYNTQLVSTTDATQFTNALQVLEHLYKRKNLIKGFVISGGEPLLNPVTKILIKNAKNLGYKIKLDTNGTLPLLLEDLLSNEDTKPNFIALDVKTSFNKYNSFINPTPAFKNADFAELIGNSIRIIKEAKIDYEIRTVLVPNLVTLDDITQIAKSLPTDACWRFAQFRNENCLDKNYNEITPYTDAELKELIDEAKKYIENSVLR